MKVTDTIVSISKDPRQKIFWRDEAKGQSGVSYSGFHFVSDKGIKESGRFDDEKFNRFIDLNITIFGKIDSEHEKLRSLEKLMVKDGKLLIKREKETNKFYFELTINEWERYDGKSNTKGEEADVKSPAAKPAAASAGKTNPFKQ